MMPSVTIDERLKSELSETTELRDTAGRVHGVFLTMVEYAELSVCKALYTFETETRSDAIADAKANHMSSAEVLTMLRATMAKGRISS